MCSLHTRGLGNDELWAALAVLTVSHAARLHHTIDEASSVDTEEACTAAVPRGTDKDGEQVRSRVEHG